MNTPQKSRYTLTRLFHDLHLWLGLGTGIIAFLLCLSGTLLVAQIPVERWVNRHVQQVVPQGEPQPLESLLPRLQAQTGANYTALTLPADPKAALILQAGRQQTFVNPYTGEVLGGIHQPTREFFMVWFRLHRWLLLDSDLGRPITGAATLMFIVLCLSGLWLWVSKALKQPRRSLLLRFKRVSWRRLNYDLHLVLGFYALIPLLVMAWSGLFWSYREPFVTSVHLVFNGQAPKPQTEKSAENAGRSDSKKAMPVLKLPYTQLLASTQQLYPYPGDVSIQFPKSLQAPVNITKINRSQFWSLPARDKLEASAESGEVLKAKPYTGLSRAEKLLGVIKDIHVGTIFNTLSLWIYFLAALIGTSLPLTGALHWGQRIIKPRRARLSGQDTAATAEKELTEV